MKVKIPEFSLVLLAGASGAGKSTFARKHFRPTEVLSSDRFRGWVADDEEDQTASKDAFEALYFVACKRLAKRRLTVIDATNVQASSRRSLLEMAREFHCFSAIIAFDLDRALCRQRNRERSDRNFGAHVVRNQVHQLRRSLRGLKREGFRFIYVLKSPDEIEKVTIERQRLWTDRRDERGPFDIIGDVHGCFEELRELLLQLGWQVDVDALGQSGQTRIDHPEGRKLIFLGDLVDRGPQTPQVLRLVMDAVAADQAICVPGNHDVKLAKALQGKRVKVAHGLRESLDQLVREGPEFQGRVKRFLSGLVSHFELDGGRLVTAHAGMPEAMQGRSSAAVRTFALYGETTGETDEFGLPVRYPWARDYRGSARVVYGHTPVPQPVWLNRTINIDTGCVFGGRLTALRYPECELSSVAAAQTYCEPIRPPSTSREASLGPLGADDDLLRIEDVLGRRHVETRLRGTITIREENGAAALEMMSRFAADPRWLIYLPPTMPPSETSRHPGLLEHPDEVFADYRKIGVEKVLCEEKHMGSRAVIVLCCDANAARRRFGVEGGAVGLCYTRTGRRFFEDGDLERCLLGEVQSAMTSADLWRELDTTWVCLDCELMPWSVKAQGLIRRQYAPVGAAAKSGLAQALNWVRANRNPSIDLKDLETDLGRRSEAVELYSQAFRRYCWPVQSLQDLRLAPFHFLASEGAVHSDKDHCWHLEMVDRLACQSPDLILKTEHLLVDLADAESRRRAVEWWTALTDAGGEGMVVKPKDFLARSRKGLAQPALKCRGREYLRIIYGPEYTEERHLTRLRHRSLRRKRSMALRELALGLEALHLFVEREPLRRVHECVFGVLALESEPVDPRL